MARGSMLNKAMPSRDFVCGDKYVEWSVCQSSVVSGQALGPTGAGAAVLVLREGVCPAVYTLPDFGSPRSQWKTSRVQESHGGELHVSRGSETRRWVWLL